MALIYLASPYTHIDKAVREARYTAVFDYVLERLKAQDGDIWYSPIVYYHPLAEAGDLPTDFDYWLNKNFDMIRKCDKLYVLKLHGWEKSLGVSAEIGFAKGCNIPIYDAFQKVPY